MKPPKKKKCAICKEEYTPKNSLQKVCSPKCAYQWVGKDNERKAHKQAQIQRKRHREDKERIKKRSEWIKEVQVEFNKYIRTRDKDHRCISCGKYEGELNIKSPIAMVCGHYLSVGSTPELRFNPNNAHLQCTRCNGGAGKYGAFNNKGLTVSKEYRLRLIEKIGLSAVEWLEGPHVPQKWTIEDLKDIKAYYREQIKLIKQGHRHG